MDTHGAAASTARPRVRLINWSRLFGYDFFISFKLGLYPSGTQSYASDLARRLREEDFSVFYSEDEAPVGEALDPTLHNALRRSRRLVVIANRGALMQSRWVRKEVEGFRGMHPHGSVIPINVAGAIQQYGEAINEFQEPVEAGKWLGDASHIWLDETDQAVKDGVASPDLVRKLANVPQFSRANTRLRLFLATGLILLVSLLMTATWNWQHAVQQTRKALAAQRDSTAKGLVFEGQTMIADPIFKGGTFRGMVQVLAGHRLSPSALTEQALLDEFLRLPRLIKLIETPSQVLAMAVSPDGKLLATAHDDGSLQLWDMDVTAPLGAPIAPGGNHQYLTVAFSPDGQRLAAGGADHSIRLWDLSTRAPIGKPFTHDNWVSSVVFSPDGRSIVSACWDGSVGVWDLASGERRIVKTPHGGGVTSLAVAPDGSRFVSGGADNTLQLWDGTTLQPLGDPMKGHKDSGRDSRIISVAYSPDGSRIVSGSTDVTLRLWDAATGLPVGAPMIGHTGWVTGAAFSPDGLRIVSAGDETIRFWDAKTGAALGSALSGHSNWVTGVLFSRDGKRVVSAGEDRTLRFWDAAPGALIGEPLRGHTLPVVSVAFSPDGSRMISGSDDSSVRLWDGSSGEPIGKPLAGHTHWVTAVAFSRDGQRFASASSDGSARVWNTQGEMLAELRPSDPPSHVLAVSFTADDRYVVTGQENGLLTRWEWNGDGLDEINLGQNATDPVSVWRLAISQDGRLLAAIIGEALVLFDTDSGIRIETDFDMNGFIPSSVAFSPKDNQLAAGGSDGTIRRWSLPGGKPVAAPIPGHNAEVYAVAYSPNGDYLVSSSRDHSLRLWDTATGRALGPPLRGHTSAVASVAFSPDGTRLVSGSWDSTLRLWPVQEDWAAGLCAKLPRNPSAEEWNRWVGSTIPYLRICPDLPEPPAAASASVTSTEETLP